MNEQDFFREKRPNPQPSRVAWRLEFWCPNTVPPTWQPLRKPNSGQKEFANREEALEAQKVAIENHTNPIRLVCIEERVVDSIE